MCERIQFSTIPDSVEHGDIRPGNIRITEKGIIFFDWAWSAFAHPFFSVSSFIHVIRRSLSDPKKRPYVMFLKEWSGFGDDESLIELYQLIDEVRDLYFVLGDSRWLKEIQEALNWNTPHISSPDALALDRRQYYYARVLRRLVKY